MGKIVAAMATVHAPQLFTRPPTEDPAQLDADIAAMRELGKTLDETKPDVAIVDWQRSPGDVFSLRRPHFRDRCRKDGASFVCRARL